MLRSTLTQTSSRRLPISWRHTVAQGNPGSSFHASAFSATIGCCDLGCHDLALGCFGRSAVSCRVSSETEGYVVASVARMSNMLVGAPQAAEVALTQWALRLLPLGIVPYALLPGWSLGEQEGNAGQELLGEEEDEGVDDVGFFSRWFDSVKRKRSAKMKRHKWKKRRKEQRQSVKKDYK